MAIGVAGGMDEGKVFGLSEPGRFGEWADLRVEVEKGGAQPGWIKFWQRTEGMIPLGSCDEDWG